MREIGNAKILILIVCLIFILITNHEKLLNLDKKGLVSINYEDKTSVITLLLDESYKIMKFARDHTYNGFPVTGWNSITGKNNSSFTNPRFLQYWNLFTLTGNKEVLEYMESIVNAYYRKAKQ